MQPEARSPRDASSTTNLPRRSCIWLARPWREPVHVGTDGITLLAVSSVILACIATKIVIFSRMLGVWGILRVRMEVIQLLHNSQFPVLTKHVCCLEKCWTGALTNNLLFAFISRVLSPIRMVSLTFTYFGDLALLTDMCEPS